MYRKILVPLDGSDIAARGLDEAIGLAASGKARLMLLHVLTDLPWLMEGAAATVDFEQMRRSLEDHADQLLASARKRAVDQGVEADTVRRESWGGRAAEVIVAEASDKGCDLIVMGSHGRRGLSRLALGSDAAAVVHDTKLPVLLVGPHAR